MTFFPPIETDTGVIAPVALAATKAYGTEETSYRGVATQVERRMSCSILSMKRAQHQVDGVGKQGESSAVNWRGSAATSTEMR